MPALYHLVDGETEAPTTGCTSTGGARPALFQPRAHFRVLRPTWGQVQGMRSKAREDKGTQTGMEFETFIKNESRGNSLHGSVVNEPD